MTKDFGQNDKSSADTTLKESFRLVGKQYGYDNVDAEFVAFKEFKVKWQRSCGWADFQVSDYLVDAPREVIEGLARTLMSKIAGSEQIPYSDDMCQWVKSNEFVKLKQPIYVRRSRDLAKTHEGRVRDLDEAFQRLKVLGLVEDDIRMFMTWTKEPNMKKAGRFSVLMRVLVISSVLDTEEIPEFVLDYVLYHEYMQMMQGLRFFGRECDCDPVESESLYPRSKEAEDWLERMCLYL